jgi:hypothetical protein
MISRMHRFLQIVIALIVVMLPPWTDTGAQSNSIPGVRGSIYESPTFGWVLLVPEPAWEIASVELAGGIETVHLVSTVGDGADTFLIASADDGRGAEGCVQTTIDSLAAAYEGYPLQGWNEPEFGIEEWTSNEFLARVRVVMSDDPALDILAFLECKRGRDGVLLAQSLLRTARDVEGSDQLPLLEPLSPGEGHTGRAGRDPGAPEEGVIRFLARTWSATEAYPHPFSCADQETFSRPTEAPSPGHGWFACDGQIANIDVVPATIDLENIVLGCANIPLEEDPPSGCPSEPVAPSQYEVLLGPAGAGGPVLTLEPGGSIEVVLWYSLPAGDPPLDILYVELERTIVAGPTFFTSGTGNRPQVRLGR